MDDIEEPTTTMGALANWEPPPDEEDFFKNIIDVLDEVYPENWRSWAVNEVSYEDLFGKAISSDDENRLRFAIPTVKLAHAYKTSSFSERKYKLIKRVLIRWPLGRALIYSPFATMKKIHPVDAYNGFAQNLTAIKRHLISRAQAVEIMKSQGENSRVTPAPISPSMTSSSRTPTRKRPHSPDVSSRKFDEFMERQNSMMEQLLSFSKFTNEMLTKGNSAPHSSNDETSDPDNNVADDWIVPDLVPEPEAQTQEPHDEVTNMKEDSFFDFAPDTKETEAKIGAANETLAKQGTHCQRLSESTWHNIRYAEVQKQFQATPVFTNLKVNSGLATVTPNWQTVALLEKMDACLGAITHGLLQQRKHFTDIYSKASLEVKAHISKNFLAADTPFRKTSDALLHYTCGRRAEIIQQRRSVYKPPNKTLNELLHAIPPSPTHLFSEPQLADFVKEQGGSNKLFPFRRQPPPNAPKLRTQYKGPDNSEKREKPKSNDTRNNTSNFRVPEHSRKRRFTPASAAKFKKPRFDSKPRS